MNDHCTRSTCRRPGVHPKDYCPACIEQLNQERVARAAERRKQDALALAESLDSTYTALVEKGWTPGAAREMMNSLAVGGTWFRSGPRSVPPLAQGGVIS